MDTRAQLQDVAAKLDALLRIRHSAPEDVAARDALTARYMVNELRRWLPDLKPAASLTEAIARAGTLSPMDIAMVRRRCLFYGCDDLIGLLVHKRVKGDAIAREEAVLYVQDRLQRDDFRRIEAFEQSRGAAFVTYMWQVINNLLLDYLRAHGKKSRREVTGSADETEFAAERTDFGADESGRVQTQAEGSTEAAQLRALLADAMDAGDDVDRNQTLRLRLREHLRLTSKERVLLKAMFQYDMTIGEIAALPGFELSAAETYRLYYRVMDRLLDAFKQAGLVDTLRGLVSNAAPRVRVSISGSDQQVSASRILCLEQAERSTECHLHWRGRTHGGSIAESFTKLCKRLASYFTTIDTKTAIADNVLAATYDEWWDTGEVSIAGVARKFRINGRILSGLKSRFGGAPAEISGGAGRITDI